MEVQKFLEAKDSGADVYTDRKEIILLLKMALGIIQWASGSSDFSEDGIAYEGWLKCQPDLELIRAKLKEWGIE